MRRIAEPPHVAATALALEMTMKNPPHPGDLIRTEIIEALGLSVSKAADILKVRRATLSDLLAGKASLSPEMALHIEKAFGLDMDHLLRMQLAYDVAQTRSHAKCTREAGEVKAGVTGYRGQGVKGGKG